MVQTILQLNALSVHASATGAANRPLVDAVSLKVKAGECFGIVGESGSGKSTICRAVAGLLPRGLTATGRALFGDTDLLGLSEPQRDAVRRSGIALVFQEPFGYFNPVYRIGWQLSEAARIRSAGNNGLDIADEIPAMLKRVGLSDTDRVMRSYPHQISGGMAQRAMIAMALLRQPRLLLADEPTTALDVTVQAQVLALLRSQVEEAGLAVMLISHDLGVIAETCDRVGVMWRGKLVEIGTVDQVLNAPKHPYTAMLVAAMPRIEAAEHGALSWTGSDAQESPPIAGSSR